MIHVCELMSLQTRPKLHFSIKITQNYQIQIYHMYLQFKKKKEYKQILSHVTNYIINIYMTKMGNFESIIHGKKKMCIYI